MPGTCNRTGILVRSVVITGVGLVGCLGSDARTTWKRLLNGEQGYNAGEPVARAVEITAVRARAIALVERACREALVDAGLEYRQAESGVVIGSSRGLQADLETGYLRNPLAAGPAAPASAVAKLVGSGGPTSALACACATGAWSIGLGYRWVGWGLCERVIVGATDAAITPLNLAGFRQAGTLASGQCRPFDRRRDGFTLAEGAAVLVLEAQSLAEARSARPYARIRGFAAANDAYHPTAPRPDGEGLARVLRQCFKEAGIGADEIDGVIAHGTGTSLNDAVEAAVIERIYGAAVPVSACKGSLGHSLGASSAIEAVLGCLALRTGWLPPSVGLAEPAFELDFVRTARASHPRTLMLHSLGFGGQNTALLLETV